MYRRDFLKISGSFVYAGLASCTPNEQASAYYHFSYIQTNYLRPPGALEEKKFVEACINCIACAESCPRGCIKFFTGSLEKKVFPHTPYIIAADNACDLCLKCTLVCPTGALMPMDDPEKVNMGIAVLEEDLCLPYINRGGCGACYTICPLNAVRLDMQRYPEVIEDKCVGCGLCEEVCIVKVKAIRVIKKT
ncbi:MAG: 4Fe-4S dicluster domain-containing protein [bacterium]|nr:4Fe-4S dicluster domain-containing protein [bacterium]